MTLQNRINEIILESKIRPARIAKSIGVSRATVSLWMNGETKNIKADNLMALCDYLRINFRWLQSGKGIKYINSGVSSAAVNEQSSAYNFENLDQFNAKKMLMIPLISWVKAGEFCESHNPFEVGDAEDWLPCPNGCGEKTYALRVKGDSMTSPYPGSRSYPDGVIIFVDPDKEVLPGNRGVFKTPDTNEVTFKELVSDAGNLYLRPINPQYDKILVDKSMTTCGLVVGSYLKE